MTVFVGSDNPVKINAVRQALRVKFPDVKIIGTAVESEVSEQPFTDEETREGAYNRARNVLALGHQLIELGEVETDENEVILGVGLEGGVFEKNPKELWTTV